MWTTLAAPHETSSGPWSTVQAAGDLLPFYGVTLKNCNAGGQVELVIGVGAPGMERETATIRAWIDDPSKEIDFIFPVLIDSAAERVAVRAVWASAPNILPALLKKYEPH
jgi:hypothetical protein